MNQTSKIQKNLDRIFANNIWYEKILPYIGHF